MSWRGWRPCKMAFIPADVQVVVTRNDGEIADDTVNGLIEHLGIAVFAVFGDVGVSGTKKP